MPLKAVLHPLETQLLEMYNIFQMYYILPMRECFRDWNTLNTHPILSLEFLTIFLIWRVKVAVLLIIMPRSLTCSLPSMFELSYDLYFAADFISCSFPYRRISNLLALNFIWFVSANLYSLCRSFYSISLSSSSFIPRRIRVSSANHDTPESVNSLFISDICIRNRRGPNTDPWCRMYFHYIYKASINTNFLIKITVN